VIEARRDQATEPKEAKEHHTNAWRKRNEQTRERDYWRSLCAQFRAFGRYLLYTSARAKWRGVAGRQLCCQLDERRGTVASAVQDSCHVRPLRV
jgi:hypothetical protein